MAALSLALSSTSTRSVGNRTQGTGTLTLTANSSTYASGGVAMPTGWKNTLGVPNTQDYVQLIPAVLPTPGDVIFGVINSSTDKLVLAGANGADAGVGVLKEVKNTGVIADGSYAMTIIAQGN